MPTPAWRTPTRELEALRCIADARSNARIGARRSSPGVSAETRAAQAPAD